jgi:hypothetical protein
MPKIFMIYDKKMISFVHYTQIIKYFEPVADKLIVYWFNFNCMHTLYDWPNII